MPLYTAGASDSAPATATVSRQKSSSRAAADFATNIDSTDIPALSPTTWLTAEDYDAAYNHADQITTDWPGHGGTASATLVSTNNGPYFQTTTAQLPGKPTVRFDSNGYYQLGSVMGASGAHMFIRVKTEPFNDVGSWSFGEYSGNGDESHYPYGGVIYDNFGVPTGNRKTVGGPPTELYPTSWHTYEVHSQANDWAAYVDGVLIYQDFVNTYYRETAPIFGYGRKNGGPDLGYVGDIAEILVFPRVLSAGEATQVRAYLNRHTGAAIPGVRGKTRNVRSINIGTAAATDALAYIKTFQKAIADSAPASDGVSATFGAYGTLRHQAESAPAADTYFRGTTRSRAIAQSAPATDAVTRVKNAPPFSWNEDVGGREPTDLDTGQTYVYRQVHLSRSFGESAPATDGVERFTVPHVAGDDARAVDFTSAHVNLSRNVQEFNYPNTVTGLSPRAYWRLGEASGTSLVDSSGNGRTGTFNAAPIWGRTSLTASADTAAEFDGTQRAQIPYGSWMNSGSLSIEFWLAMGPPYYGGFNFSTQGVILARDATSTSNSVFRVMTQGQSGVAASLYYTNNGAAGAGTNPYFMDPDGITRFHNLADWTPHHYVITVSSTGWVAYLDGVQNSSGNPYPGVTIRQPTLTDMFMGDWYHATTRIRLAGILDDVTVYPVKLTATQVADLYAAGRIDKVRDIARPSGGVRVRAVTDTAHATDVSGVPKLRAISDSAPATDAASATLTTPTYDIFDSFSRPDDETSLGFTEVGSYEWQYHAGVTWGVVGGAAQSMEVATTPSYLGTTWLDMGTPDVEMSATWTNYEYYAGFAFRIVSDSDYMFAYFDGGDIYWYKDGDYNWLGGGDLNHNEGDRYTLSLSGEQIRLYQNGVVGTQVESAINITSTLHGLLSEGTGDRIDDFAVTFNPVLEPLNGMYQNRKVLTGTSGTEMTPPYYSAGEYFRFPGSLYYTGGVERGEIDFANDGFTGPSFWYEWVCPVDFPAHNVIVFEGIYEDYPDYYGPTINVWEGEISDEVTVELGLDNITVVPGGNTYDATIVAGDSHALVSNDDSTSYVQVPSRPNTTPAVSRITGTYDGSSIPAGAIITQVEIVYRLRDVDDSGSGIAYLRTFDGSLGGFGTSFTDEFSASTQWNGTNWQTQKQFIYQPAEWITAARLRAGNVKGELGTFTSSFGKPLEFTYVALRVRYRASTSFEALTPVSGGQTNIYLDHIDYNEVPLVPWKPTPGTSYKISVAGDDSFSEERTRFRWYTEAWNDADDPSGGFVLPSTSSGASAPFSMMGSTWNYDQVDRLCDPRNFFYQVAGSVWAKWTAPLDWDTSKLGTFRITTSNDDAYLSISVFDSSMTAVAGAHDLPQNYPDVSREEREQASTQGFPVTPGETYHIWLSTDYERDATFFVEWSNDGVLFRPPFDDYQYGNTSGYSYFNMDDPQKLTNATLQPGEEHTLSETRSIWTMTSLGAIPGSYPDGTIFRLTTSLPGVHIRIYAAPNNPRPVLADLPQYFAAEGTGTVDFAMDASHQYQIQLTDSDPSATRTTVSFHVELAPGLTPPPNDDHGGAIALLRQPGTDPIRRGVVTGTLLAATLDPAGYANPAGIVQDVWYSWVSPITGPVTFDVPSGNQAIFMSAFTEDGTLVATSTGAVSYTLDWTWNAIEGVKYLIRVGATSSNQNFPFTFRYPMPNLPTTGAWKVLDYENSVMVKPGCLQPGDPRMKVYDYVNGRWVKSLCDDDELINDYFYWGPWITPPTVEVPITMGATSIYGVAEPFQSFGGGYGSLLGGDAFECSFHLARHGLYRIQYWWSNGNGIQWNGGPGTCPTFNPAWNDGYASTGPGSWSGVVLSHVNPSVFAAGWLTIEVNVPYWTPNLGSAATVQPTVGSPPTVGATVQKESPYSTLVGLTMHLPPPTYLDSGEVLNYYLIPYRETMPAYGFWYPPNGIGTNAPRSGDPASDVAAGTFIGSHSSTSDPTIDFEVPPELLKFPYEMNGTQTGTDTYFPDGTYRTAETATYQQAAYPFQIMAVTSRVRDDDSPTPVDPDDGTWRADGITMTCTATVQPSRYRWSEPPRPLKGWDYANGVWTEICCTIPDATPSAYEAETPGIRSQGEPFYEPSTGTLTITPPGDISAGDRQLLFVYQQGANNFFLEDGWTNLGREWTDISAELYTKISDGTESNVVHAYQRDGAGHFPTTASAIWMSLEGEAHISETLHTAYAYIVTSIKTAAARRANAPALTFIIHDARIDASRSDFTVTGQEAIIIDPDGAGHGPLVSLALTQGDHITTLDDDDYGKWVWFTVCF